MGAIALAWCFLAAAASPDVPVHPGRANAVTFPAREARFVRFVIHQSVRGQPCIDELEVYGPGGGANLAAASRGAKATASSCLAGYAIHKIAHLNDGRYGNSHSWIAATAGAEWAQIELPRPAKVAKVVFSRDREGRYTDRVPVRLEVRLSPDGRQWTTVRKVATTTAVPPPAPGRSRGAVPPPPPAARTDARRGDLTGPVEPDDLLRYAILAEEHAWVKAFGRADLSPRLVPYNGRVKQYPRHVADDRLPLPPLPAGPKLDGRLDDACWAAASRGTVRVAWPYDYDQGPLVEHAVRAGWKGEELLLAVRTDRLLSAHVAVVTSGDGRGGGAVAWTPEGIVLRPGAAAQRPVPLQAVANATLTCWEIRLPLSLLPQCRTRGIRVGLGMGGKHTHPTGRAVHFAFSPLSVAEVGPSRGGTFRVRVTSAGGQALELTGSAGGLAGGLVLQPGESRVLSVPARSGPIGPEHELTVRQAGRPPYVLGLFRYDPLGRTLRLLGDMIDRLARRGLDVAAERADLGRLRAEHERLLPAASPDRPAERKALFQARRAKRRLFFREPDLAPLGRVLFVKRHAFEPSHNYSVLLDSRYRPGGGVCVLSIPRRGGRLRVDEGEVRRLFDATAGIARNPMAGFDARRIYFAYRPSAAGYYHLMSMASDGGDVRQLTSGPFHDYWPCPLPDGGLAFISTRCRARYLCWRPQAAVLFRMDADGTRLRALSFANLSEWGPSVMTDGRIIWQRSEYIDKGADFSHTLWAIRPDGTAPELIFGNTIIQPNGYANGREVPGTREVCCTLISHFGDLNGPIALLDIAKGRFNPEAITSLTPEVPWPGMWPREECFRDPVPVDRDYVLCSHAPRGQFGLYVIDRFGNREVLHLDPRIGSMCPTLLRPVKRPPVLAGAAADGSVPEGMGQFVLADVYQGIAPAVPRGKVKYVRVAQEVRADLIRLPSGEYQKDHRSFQDWYATPVHKVRGPHGWPSYVAKGTFGLAPVAADGSASFYAPAGKQLYFQALDEDFNELQRMRSVIQLQPGERRGCIGCHEGRQLAPTPRHPSALRREASRLDPPPWGAGPVSFEKVVQPVLDARCARCHHAKHKRKIDLTASLDGDLVPAAYRTLISQGWVHYLDCGWNSGGNAKAAPLTFGTVRSKLWRVLGKGHHGVKLSADEMRRIKCWTDLNCPLWADYIFRPHRRRPADHARRP